MVGFDDGLNVLIGLFVLGVAGLIASAVWWYSFKPAKFWVSCSALRCGGSSMVGNCAPPANMSGNPCPADKKRLWLMCSDVTGTYHAEAGYTRSDGRPNPWPNIDQMDFLASHMNAKKKVRCKDAMKHFYPDDIVAAFKPPDPTRYVNDPAYVFQPKDTIKVPRDV